MGELLEVELFEILDFLSHSLAVDGHFGELFFGSAEGRGQEGVGLEGGFGLGLWIGNGSGAEEVFDWGLLLGGEGLGEELRRGGGLVGEEELTQISH